MPEWTRRATRPASVSDRGAFASASVTRHLARGAIGFGLIGAALVLTSSIGAIALLLAPLGMVALRGCPTCWTLGLIETVSAGRLRRACGDDGCVLLGVRDSLEQARTARGSRGSLGRSSAVASPRGPRSAV
jgi:hypothetical protein